MVASSNTTRVAIVTGGSKGIGLATAEALGALGWRVAMVARSERDLKKACQCLNGSIAIAADVAQRESIDAIVDRTMDEFGRIDALVNNAGYAPLLPIEQTTDEIWQDAIDVNLSATFRLCRACWPIFGQQGGGVVVNVSSASARDPFPGFIAYGAAKAAVNNLGLSLAREGAKHNIRVHTVAPGATETAMFRALPGMSAFPKEDALAPADVARVIVGCITGDLAHTSGEVIYLHKGA